MNSQRMTLAASVVLATLLATTVAGCSPTPAEPTDQDFGAGLVAQATADGTAAGEQLATDGPVDLESHTIAFLNYTSQANALRRVESGMHDAADAIGWDFVSCDAQGDPQKVASCASSFIQQGVDVIASVAIPQALMTANMQDARDAGIPWISSGGQLPDNEDLFAGSFFYPEEKLYGPLDTLFLDSLGSDDVEIATLQLTVDSTARARQEKLDADLAGYPNVSVAVRIEGSPADPGAATAAVVAALQQHPDIRGIWSCCDILNQPIVQAVNEVGLTGDDAPLVVGAFPDEAMLAALRDGKMFAAMELPWEAYGWMAVDEAAQNIALDADFTQHGEPDQYPTDLYAGQLITDENVQQTEGRLQDAAYDYVTYFTAKWDAEFAGRS